MKGLWSSLPSQAFAPGDVEKASNEFTGAVRTLKPSCGLARRAGDVGEDQRAREGVRPAAVQDHDLRAGAGAEHVHDGGQRHRLERQVVGIVEGGVGRDEVVGAGDLHAMAGEIEDNLAVLVDLEENALQHRLEAGLVEVGVLRHRVVLLGQEVRHEPGVRARRS